MNNNSTSIKEQENTLAGVVGAFLFSLIGGVLWFVLYQIGFLAAASGFVGVICAVKGYTFFSKAKTESVKCIAISSVMTALSLIIAWYFCVAYIFYIEVQNEINYLINSGEISSYTYTFFDALRELPTALMLNTNALIAYLADLGTGLLCAVLGVIYYLSVREKKMKAAAAQKATEAILANTNDEESVPTESTEKAEESEEIKYDKDVE